MHRCYRNPNTYDGLGRLLRVRENGLSATTCYGYDVLDNLTAVRQGATLSGSSCSGGQLRTFAYDSLSRLKTAVNPESGTTTYTYDDDGNLLTMTDARGGTVTHPPYDGLHRIQGSSYSGGGSDFSSTPAVTYTYATSPTSNCKNAGRLTAVSSSVSTTSYSCYDSLGRVTTNSQQTGGSTYRFSYAYNLDDSLSSVTYPSTRKLAYQYDAAGRLTAVGENTVGATDYASAIRYKPHGGINTLTLGNGLYESWAYNQRLQTTQIKLGATSGGSDKLKLEFDYGASTNNGNLLSQIITRPGLSALTQSYGYDGANRLSSAAESGAGAAWSRSYDYDVYGNRAVTANSGLPTSPLMPTATTNYSSATNRLTLNGSSYDDAGNLTDTPLGETLVYDAENRLTSYTLSSATTNYKYGPQGRRVRKVTPTVTETYVYDAFGKLAAEYSTNAPTSGGTFYRTSDHLGSTRLVTRQDQSDADCYDYAPFGEEIPDTLGSRSSNNCFAASFDGRHRFTGKERDSESDLDYFLARYYSGPMGRFLSVDPESAGADPEFPQTWNAYAYVNNNPLKLVDPDGRVVFTAAALAYLAFEVVSTAIDVVNAVQTVRDPNATTADKAVAVVGAVAGLALPGPTGTGATAVAKGVRAAGNAIDAASDSSKALKAANAAQDAKGGTYTLVDRNTGKVRRTGMTNNLERRRKEHQRGKETGDLDFVIDKQSDNPAARRGREQRLYDEHKKTADLNRRRPIAPNNPKLKEYLKAGDELGP